MRLLLDECVPRKLKFIFAEAGHECDTVTDAGFSGKENGELLAVADEKFDVLVTVDKNIRYQQNISGRNLALLVIRATSNDLDDIRIHMGDALAALLKIRPGEVVEVGIPLAGDSSGI
jgi:predicted nuclease of predicted toxin-antitoxin system